MLRWPLRLYLLLTLTACATPEIEERCRFVTEHVRPPPMSAEFGEVDRALVKQVIDATLLSRELRGSLARSFRLTFASELLPELCSRLDRARALASSGEVRAAGSTYQSLLLASQVLQLTLAVWLTAERADHAGQPSFQITTVLGVFARDMRPLLEAALSESPAAMASAISTRGTTFGSWIAYLERWSRQVESAAEQVRTAQRVWHIAMLVIATHNAAVGLAGLMSAGPPAAGGALAATSGSAVLISELAYLQVAEALRKLIASGALDTAVVAAMGTMLATGNAPPAVPDPALPSNFKMGQSDPAPSQPSSPSAPQPEGLTDIARFRSELRLPPGEGVIARLDVAGRRFYGINAHGQAYERFPGVTFQSLRHAEGDAFVQATRAGIRGGKATLFVDRAVCGWCLSSLRSYARELRLHELTVVEPGRTFVVTP